MMHAYDEMYLEKARIALGRMFDFVVYQLGYNINKFFEMFIVSGLAKRFENGDVSLLVGKSGVEMGYEVIYKTFGEFQPIEIEYTVNRSPEYWAGWVLAYYQWQSGKSFSSINKEISLEVILEMYYPYHEMDIRQTIDAIEQLVLSDDKDTKLKQRRKQLGLSQSGLAKKTDIPVRTIQQYEQRQKEINMASADRLLRLAKVLYCRPENLMEVTDEKDRR